MSQAASTFSLHEAENTPVSFIDLQAQHRPIAAEIAAAVQQVFDDQDFVLGDKLTSFEAEVAKYCDSRHAIGCASGTDALVLSLMALEIGPGDEVITSPFSFFATAGAIWRVGATPIFVDIDPLSLNLDPNAVEAAVTEKTKAIMPVHIFGQCAEMETLWRLAVRGGFSIIEDACQAIGAHYHGRKAGVLGTVGCFSFFPTKNLGGAGDGGLVTTDDAELASRLKKLRVHGAVEQYQHLEVGLNSRLDALQAAVLKVKLGYLDEWTEARQENARRYGELFRHYQLLDAVDLPTTLPDRRHVYNQYTIRVKGEQRDAIMQHLRDRQIGCTIYYPCPLHLQPCFGELGYQRGQLPECEAACDEVLSLPIHPHLTATEQELVVRGVASALGRLTSDMASPNERLPKYLPPEKSAA